MKTYEWTAADVRPQISAKMVQMQLIITPWQQWAEASKHSAQHVLISMQAKKWSDKTVDFSGLV